jgi:N-acetylglucosamine-6-sulfatase
MFRSDIFPDVRAPRRANYNYTPPNMHWLIAQQEAIQPGYEEWWIDELMRNRWRTLLSVDDLIEGVVAALDDTGVLENTWIFFTSDHGQNLGHYKLPSCKLNVYEHDVRVPLLVRGPGLLPGTVISALAGNTDLAPTILDLAGGPGAVNPIMDGKSFASVLTSSGVADWTRDTFLIEYNSLGDVLRGAPG